MVILYLNRPDISYIRNLWNLNTIRSCLKRFDIKDVRGSNCFNHVHNIEKVTPERVTQQEVILVQSSLLIKCLQIVNINVNKLCYLLISHFRPHIAYLKFLVNRIVLQCSQTIRSSKVSFLSSGKGLLHSLQWIIFVFMFQ